MVKVKESIIGKKFYMLTVLQQVEDKVGEDGKHRDRYLCICDCGNECFATGQLLKRGGTKSCGCLKKEIGNKIKRFNKYDLNGEFGIGYTRNTNRPFYFDKEDFNKIKDYCWSENKNPKDGYIKLCARDRESKKTITFSSVVFGKNVDHINRNTLDNRKCNLRFANATEQNYNKALRKDNTSGFVGVYFDKCCNKYRASIRNKGKTYYSKACETKEEAKQERLQLEKRFCGEFSPKSRSGEDYAI